MKTPRTSIRRPLGGFVLVLALGCARGAEPVADYEVALAVKRYNEALPRAYAERFADPMAEVATPDEMQRIEDIIAFLAQGNRTMDARQESFERGEVTHEGEGKATAEATEVWWYRHWIPATREVKQAARRVKYTSRYTLLRIDGRWRVDKLEELKYEELPVEPGA